LLAHKDVRWKRRGAWDGGLTNERDLESGAVGFGNLATRVGQQREGEAVFLLMYE